MRHSGQPDCERCLSAFLGNLCAQPGVRCLQRLDLGLDLPLEGAAPPGQARLLEHFQPALPGEQAAGNDAFRRSLGQLAGSLTRIEAPDTVVEMQNQLVYSHCPALLPVGKQGHGIEIII